MSSSSFPTRHRRRASIVAAVVALLATLVSATPASADLTGNEPITTIAGTAVATAIGVAATYKSGRLAWSRESDRKP